MKLQTLELNTDELPDDIGDIHAEPVGFWKRQFAQVGTAQQRRFDWAYGVGVPLICVAADPFVFTGPGKLASYQTFAYLLSATSILGMAAWLLWGERLKWLAAPLGGFFIAGSLISMVIGVILLPFSLIGLLFLIGFLGFTPLLSGVVYLRNGVRAIRSSGSFMAAESVMQAAILAALFGLVIPFIANVYVPHLVNRQGFFRGLD